MRQSNTLLSSTEVLMETPTVTQPLSARPSSKRSKRRKRIILGALVLLVGTGITLALVFRKREVIIPVQTEKVTRRNLTETVIANGRIQPVVQVKISPEVSGEIIEAAGQGRPARSRKAI